MRKRMLCASLAVVGLLGLALVVSAQRPGLRQNFGYGGTGRWSSAKCAPNCPQYQFSYKRETMQPILLPDGKTSTITNTTTGTVAGNMYGSTYHDVTLSAVVPGQSQAGPQEFIYVRDMDPGVMMNYIEHIAKGGTTTYEQSPIKLPPANVNSNPNWKGGGPSKGAAGGPGKGPTITKKQLTNYVLDSTYTCPDAEETTLTLGDSVTQRVYCSTLQVLLEEHRHDRFAASHYKLFNYTSLQVLPFTPTGTLVKGRQFGHHGGPRGAGRGTPPPTP